MSNSHPHAPGNHKPSRRERNPSMPKRTATRLTLALLGLALAGSLALAQSGLTLNPFVGTGYHQITDAEGNTISAMSDPNTPLYASRGQQTRLPGARRAPPHPR